MFRNVPDRHPTLYSRSRIRCATLTSLLHIPAQNSALRALTSFLLIFPFCSSSRCSSAVRHLRGVIPAAVARTPLYSRLSSGVFSQFCQNCHFFTFWSKHHFLLFLIKTALLVKTGFNQV